MIIDSTFEFEKRRNIPVRYDRELLQTTIKVMKRVAEIKAKRETRFYKNRIAIGKEKNRKARTAKKLLVAKKDAEYVPSVQLLEPVSWAEPAKEKIKVLASTSKRSAMVPGEGQSMGMDID